jgi:monoamine oxidase
MAQGSVIKCMAVYGRPFWREQGLSGEATSDRGPVRVVFDNSPPPVMGAACCSASSTGRRRAPSGRRRP